MAKKSFEILGLPWWVVAWAAAAIGFYWYSNKLKQERALAARNPVNPVEATAIRRAQAANESGAGD